ncbi:hypothetical protein VCM_00038 [Pseudomonas phage VCM]|uniref:Uncharacterized protein n=1 Tax=Pseudomonas phage VCM TaxID=1729937 RepID=A0A0S4KW39_9CAUD|nr:hypothetical protein VCM_00038 [Pseudomonas phage VCM]CUR44257.1 hypothetical protein VCM_00038 [Pseudomonas phage VCM]
MTYALGNLLFIAIEVHAGRLSLEGATRVEVERQEVNTYGDTGRYIDYVSVDAERMGYDEYSFNLTPAEYTVEEVIAYINGPYKADLEAYNREQKEAVALVAQLATGVQDALQEMLAVAKKYDIPANIKINGRTNDFRLIDAVDWDSSSMYC